MRLFLLCFLAILFPTSHAFSQQAVLLGPDLEPTSVQLQALSPEAIKVVDGQGNTLELKPEQVLRLTMNRIGSAQGPKRSAVTLTDGQVLVGQLVPSNDDDADRIKLDHDRAVQVPLDEMMSLSIDRDALVPRVQDDDALLLATVEVLFGFVETIDDEAVGFVVGEADDAIRIPLDRIKALVIANKPKAAATERGTVRVYTVDGSVLLIQQATLESTDSGDVLVGDSTLPILPSRGEDEGVSTASSSRLSVPMQRVVKIEPASTRHTLSLLSGHAWRLVGGGEVFGVKMPPTAERDGTIRLHAPTTLGFDVPKGASRLTLTAAMDLDDTVSESRRQMAGCVLVIYEGDRVLARQTLTDDSPPTRLNLPLTGGALRIDLEPGVNGPVLDRVVLTEAELLVSE